MNWGQVMDIRIELLSIFRDLEFDPDEIKDDTNLRDDLSVDSTELAEISVAIENRLIVEIDYEKFSLVRTFGDVVQYVASAPRAA